MCGITGFSNLTKDISSYRNVLNDMTDIITKRGPDEIGYFIDKHIAFGHRRLIVIDPEGGKQPMQTVWNENTYTIVYNGQIYNSEELRQELKEIGFPFETHCDTEVLLKAIIYYGPSVLQRINGIFSFALWDSKKNELFLARDHFGIKPLYYTLINNTLIFSSEVKSILKYPFVESKIDSDGICELFGLGPAHTPRKYNI